MLLLYSRLSLIRNIIGEPASSPPVPVVPAVAAVVVVEAGTVPEPVDFEDCPSSIDHSYRS